MDFDMDSKEVRFVMWIILLLSVLYIGGHFVKAHAWDGTAEYNTDISTETDISIDTGTKQTIESTGQVTPGMDIEVHDWETNETKEIEITNINPPTGGPTQMEGYSYDSGDYLDLRLDLN